MKYVLISVLNRDICTEQYNSFEEAHNQMIKELKEEFAKNIGCHLIKEKKGEWNSFNIEKEVNKYGVYLNDDYRFCVGTNFAWYDADNDWLFDWKIIEVQ